uniref:hypothetical protein n=1 Tax=Thiocapsa sp. TaxID=2024551 RepID=UPI00359461B1
STSLPTLVAIVALTGCAALRLDPTLPASVGVESIDSSRASITSVVLRDHAGELAVSGRLQKRLSGRSPIPGHLHIEAIAADGAVLAETVSTYRRLSPKIGMSEFSQRLAVPSARVERVRVTHHATDHEGSDAAPQAKA